MMQEIKRNLRSKRYATAPAADTPALPASDDNRG
jgi:hypothetical protein